MRVGAVVHVFSIMMDASGIGTEIQPPLEGRVCRVLSQTMRTGSTSTAEILPVAHKAATPATARRKEVSRAGGSNQPTGRFRHRSHATCATCTAAARAKNAAKNGRYLAKSSST